MKHTDHQESFWGSERFIWTIGIILTALAVLGILIYLNNVSYSPPPIDRPWLK